MLKALSLLLLFSVTAGYAGELVIISDLDETTRIANIEKKVKAGLKLIAGVKPYEGLRSIYKEIKIKNPDTKIYYLSNSFPFLYRGEKWVKDNGYPEGEVMQRSLGDKSDSFKPQKLKDIYAAHPGATFMLFGDNIEKDPDFYRNFLNETPGIDAKVYIRDARLIFPQEENFIYFQTEAQITDDLNMSAETTQEVRELPFHKLVPKFLLKNLKRRLEKSCKESRKTCRQLARDRVQEVVNLIKPRAEEEIEIDLNEYDDREELAELEEIIN